MFEHNPNYTPQWTPNQYIPIQKFQCVIGADIEKVRYMGDPDARTRVLNHRVHNFVRELYNEKMVAAGEVFFVKSIITHPRSFESMSTAAIIDESYFRAMVIISVRSGGLDIRIEKIDETTYQNTDVISVMIPKRKGISELIFISHLVNPDIAKTKIVFVKNLEETKQDIQRFYELYVKRVAPYYIDVLKTIHLDKILAIGAVEIYRGETFGIAKVKPSQTYRYTPSIIIEDPSVEGDSINEKTTNIELLCSPTGINDWSEIFPYPHSCWRRRFKYIYELLEEMGELDMGVKLVCRTIVGEKENEI